MQEVADPWDELSDQEKRFVTAYLGTARFNAVAAAKEAGYSHPSHQSWRLRHRTDIAKVIEAELQNRAMGKGEILDLLRQIAFRPGAAWLKVSSRGATVDMKAARDAGLLDLVEGFDYNKQGKLIVKMPSRMEALALLAKAQGMLKENGATSEGQQALSLLREMLFGEEPSGEPVVGRVE